MDWVSLKSGSDVRGTAIGEGTVLTDEIARALGFVFARKLAEDQGKDIGEITVALGRDSREEDINEAARRIVQTVKSLRENHRYV